MPADTGPPVHRPSPRPEPPHLLTWPQGPTTHCVQGWVLQDRVLLGLSASSQRPGSGQVTRRCCSPPPQASEHWEGRGRVCRLPASEDTPTHSHLQISEPHLPPGRGVPAEAGLGPTGPAGGRLGGPRLAVERPQWLEVPCVHTLHVPCGGAPAAAAGALEARENFNIFNRAQPPSGLTSVSSHLQSQLPSRHAPSFYGAFAYAGLASCAPTVSFVVPPSMSLCPPALC